MKTLQTPQERYATALAAAPAKLRPDLKDWPDELLDALKGLIAASERGGFYVTREPGPRAAAISAMEQARRVLGVRIGQVASERERDNGE